MQYKKVCTTGDSLDSSHVVVFKTLGEPWAPGPKPPTAVGVQLRVLLKTRGAGGGVQPIPTQKGPGGLERWGQKEEIQGYNTF